MAIFAVGLFLLSSLTTESSDISIILRLMLCGAGFGLFQTPNNSTIISCSATAFGRCKWNVGHGPSIGADYRNNVGGFAFQLCHARPEYSSLSDSRKRIRSYSGNRQQFETIAAFYTEK